jgi:hypothetical protein
MALCQQQPVVAGMLYQPAADFHQLLLQAGQRPRLDFLRQHPPPPQVDRAHMVVDDDFSRMHSLTLSWAAFRGSIPERRRDRERQKEYECGSEAHKAAHTCGEARDLLGFRGRATDQEVSLVAVCVALGKVPGRIA